MDRGRAEGAANLIGKLAQPFRNRGDEESRRAVEANRRAQRHLQTLIEQWSSMSTWPHHAAKRCFGSECRVQILIPHTR